MHATRMPRRALLAGLGGAALLAPLAAWPQDAFPAKAVRIMYPFSPGGGMELVLRVMADQMQRSTGQAFIVDNRTGAGGAIAVNAMVTAPPDGYTLFVGPVGISAITPHLRKLPYDTLRDMQPVAKLSEFHSAYTVANNLPVKTLPEFIAYAKANPGKVTFATSGIGSQGHLRGEMLQKEWGIQMTHVPYKGAADITNDLLGGRVDFTADVTMLQYVKQGKARLLAVDYAQRLPDFPDVPTVSELPVPRSGTSSGTWFGAFAPKGTPQAVLDKLAAEFDKALKLPEVAAKMRPFAMQPAFAGPAAFRKQWEADYASYGRVIKELGIKIDQ
ncbi:tripartite tricarboxylate transporter substrate binding protein [Ottowia sp. GY511]|uniref:Bug family tripartite tricarboxylate transporter substrate binding protein n=1 Tax=Ottowia flava TaxID=2675430 RepID=A0ABW4KPV3_9BURK|nr:tripartite tricarboxylate transporter substrate binding protein [Ottowia sp. GY511]TXK26339.1 tripartite tricarboxylate transporter substrate binding protein [Ottowia sp. GY511]